jgi:hypothetical protein
MSIHARIIVLFMRGRPNPYPSLHEALWLRVERAGLDDCWLWQGAVNNKGYGHLTYGGVKYMAHSLAFVLAGGIKAKRDVCHSCDHPLCCNPRHLFNGSRSENMLDAVAKKRISPLILSLIERSGSTAEERAVRKADRAIRSLNGRRRDSSGRYYTGYALGVRKRNTRGHFIKG